MALRSSHWNLEDAAGLAAAAALLAGSCDTVETDACTASLLGLDIACWDDSDDTCGLEPAPESCATRSPVDLTGLWSVTVVITEELPADTGCDGDLMGKALGFDPMVIVQEGNALIVDGEGGVLECEGTLYLDGGFLPSPGPFEAHVVDLSGEASDSFVRNAVAGCGGTVVEVVDPNHMRQELELFLGGCTVGARCDYLRVGGAAPEPVVPFVGLLGLGVVTVGPSGVELEWLLRGSLLDPVPGHAGD